jgi:cytoskeleton protein RodZ
MESFGEYLRQLRTTRGVSLAEISRLTRVGQRYLQALEGNALEELPAAVFTKGFIRAYCQAVGEPPDEALARYRDLVGEATPEPAPSLTVRPKAPARGPVFVSLTLLLALGLALFVATLTLQRGIERAPAPEEASVPGGGQGAPAPRAVAPKAEEPPRSRLVARATEPTWVRVQMDDGSVVQELLPAGATREWVSERRFVLTVGNAGGLVLELNGRPIPPLGARGAVIQNLVITADAEPPRP